MRTELEKIIDQALYDSINSGKSSKDIANTTVSEITKEYEPLVNSLAIANKHNNNLTQDIIRLEHDIHELKQFIDKHTSFPESNDKPSDIYGHDYNP